MDCKFTQDNNTLSLSLSLSLTHTQTNNITLGQFEFSPKKTLFEAQTHLDT